MQTFLHRIGAAVAFVCVAGGISAGCDAIDDAKSVYKGEAGVAQKAPEGNRSRVNAVQAATPSAMPEGWCEKKYAAGQGPKLALPETSQFSQGAISVAGRPRWINMWATWCKPCVAEMPLIMRWRDARLGTGTDISLEMLSVDENVDELKSFLARHREMGSSKIMHLRNPAGLAAFAQTLGLGADASVPIHIFTDRNDNITCVRTGGIAESDLGVIRELMK